MTIHQAIYERLKEGARLGCTVTYGEIAPLANLNMELQVDRNKMSEILAEISTYEHENSRPMLSAIVVHKDSGYPGKGFYELARFLSLYQGHGEFSDLDFFTREVKKVFSYWSRN